MKKVFALGVASLLMMGTASQALAAFEYGQLTMVVYDRTAQKEIGFDLGSIDTLLSAGTSTMTIDIGNNGWVFDTAKSGIGVFADATDYEHFLTAGYFAITSNDPAVVALGSNTTAWETAVTRIKNAYGPDADGVISTAAAGSYTKMMNLSSSTGIYAGMRSKAGLEAEYPVAAGSVVTMYLYSFDTNPVDGNVYLSNEGQSAATITLNNAGLFTFTATPAAVPVPGAAILFGSSLLGLAGVRRRLNS